MRKIALILAMLILIAGCGNKNQPYNTFEKSPSEVIYDPPQGGDINIYALRPDTLNPIDTKYSVNRDALNLVFEPLIAVNQDYTLKYMLAESCSVSNGGTVFTLNLRTGARWHDGTEFTANDVDFTVKFILSEKDKSIYYQNISDIESSRIINQNTYEITLKNPNSGFVYLLDFPIIKNNSATIKTDETDSEKKEFEHVGTGMYYISDYVLNKGINLKSNTNWWGGNVNISDVTVNLMPDRTSFYNGFKMNNMDVVISDYENSGKFSLGSDVLSKSLKTGKYVYLSVNHSNKLLADISLRKILNEVISTEKITTELIPTYSSACESPLASAQYQPADTQTPDDIKRRLVENGFVPGEKSRVKNIDGTDYALIFDLLVNGDVPAKTMLAEYIATELMSYGIMVNVIKADDSDFVSKAISGEYDFVLCETEISKDSDITFLVGSGGRLNIGNYSSETMDTLISKMKTADTLDLRNTAISEINNLFKEDVPHIPMLFYNDVMHYSGARMGEIDAGSIDREFDAIYNWTLKR